MKKHIPLLLLLILGTALSFGNKITICGTVYDDSEIGKKNPLPGANVIIKGTATGITTNHDGEFCIEIPDSSTIFVISSIGLKTVEINAKELAKNHQIRLIEDEIAVDEIVMITYETSTPALDKAKPAPKIAKTLERKASGTDIIANPSKSKTHKSTEIMPSMSKLLTAGEVNDFSKWELWNDIADFELAHYKNLWKFTPKQRYSVQVVNKQNMPVINAEVLLLNNKKDTIWTAKTDNTGKAELWANAFAEKSKNKYSIEIHYKNQIKKIAKAKEFHKKIHFVKIDTEYTVPDIVDIAFVVDATGSMGDEIAYLKNDMASIMQQVNDTVNAEIINIGSVFYKDYGDDYVTKTKAFTNSVDSVVLFIAKNQASGGGDTPEAVDDALDAAINNLSWNKNALSRIIFLILDAPPHNETENIKKLQKATKEAAKKGIRIIPVTCSGINKSTEYLMRSIALFTNGTYSFLTDDSGIGNPHIKPSTDQYTVETFNDLIVRLLYQFTHTPTLLNNEQQITNDTIIVSENIANNDSEKNQNENQAFEWKYYPNPTTQFVHLILPAKITEIFICDISGKIIKRIHEPAQKETINLEGLPLGIYYICFEDTNGKMHKKPVLKVN